MDWGIGVAVSNRNMPDRKRFQLNDKMEAGVIALSASNDISREFTRLDENVVSANYNFEHGIDIGNWTPTLKAGAFA